MRTTAIALGAALLGCGGSQGPPHAAASGDGRAAQASSAATSATNGGTAEVAHVAPSATALAFVRSKRAGASRPSESRVVVVDYDAIPVAQPNETASRVVHVSIDRGDGAALGVSIDAPLLAEVELPVGRFYTSGRFWLPQGDPCRPSARPAVKAFALRSRHWSDESVEVAWLGGTLDSSSCVASLTEEASARATAVVPGLAYAVRQAKTSSVDPDLLWIVMPGPMYVATAPISTPTIQGPVTRVALPVAVGASASLVATFAKATVDAWRLRGGLPRDLESQHDALSLTVEVAWPRGGAAPSCVGMVAPLDASASALVSALGDSIPSSEVP